MSSGRGWCFTINNPNANDAEDITKLSVKAKYLIFGREVGEEGTPHYQGYVYYKNNTRLTGVKKDLRRAHIEYSRGNIEQNIEYCSKDGEFWEFGERPVSSKRKGDMGREMEQARWANARDLAMQAKWKELSETEPKIFVLHHQHLQRAAALLTEAPDELEEMPGWWYWGVSGAGKTTKARRENPGAYVKALNKWWCGYRGEECVIVDDMSPQSLKECSGLTDMLKLWGDRWSFACEPKGGHMIIRPKKVIITSQYRIDEVWQDEETRQAMKRRYREVHINPLSAPPRRIVAPTTEEISAISEFDDLRAARWESSQEEAIILE